MTVSLRQERPEDYAGVSEVIKAAFRNMELSDQTEHFLVERLRRSGAFIPELSIVAESGKEIAGHILLTRVRIINEQDSFESLALAPVSVKPGFQRRGIGGALIRKSHQVAARLGFRSVVLIGHEDYYPKFGYKQAGSYGIAFPFEAPAENCMVIALSEGGLDGIRGKVEYPAEFFE